MSVLAWTASGAAAAVAILAAGADGALSSPHGAPARSTGSILPATDRSLRREHRHRALSITRVIAYLATGAGAARGAIDLPLGGGARVAASIVVALAVVALSEGAARSVGYALGMRALGRIAPLLDVLATALAPVLAIGSSMERMMERLLPPVGASAIERETSTERFREVVAAEADVSTAEEALIHGVFSLGDTEVHEVMVPRVDIVGIEAETPWSEVVDRVRSSEHARLPVYRETLDDIVGVLYAKDLLPPVVADEEPDGGWRTLVRPAVFIPPSKTIDAQLRDFKASRSHMAIVSDEYGGTAGLLTIEDVLEEIVGDIRDEYDVEPGDVEREGTSRFWVAGRVTLDELSDVLGVDLETENVTTVGGLVYELFGRVPRPGETMIVAGYRLVVERVRRRRIQRVYFERLEPVGSRPQP